MESKATKFELFRYQLLPINRNIQGDFVNGINSVEELIEKKNVFFAQSIQETKDFSNNKLKIITKKLFDRNDFFLLKIAVRKRIHRETEEFKEEDIDTWPAVLVAIWNDPEKQIIAVQKKTQAFRTSKRVVDIIMNAILPKLRAYQLTTIVEPTFEKHIFWDLLKKHKNNVKSIEFKIITPNMANISGELSEELKSFAKISNSTTNTLKMESDSEASLNLDSSNNTLNGLVNYASNGGGDISLKVKGITSIIHTTQTVKSVEIDSFEMTGKSSNIVEKLKEIIDKFT